MENNSNVFSRWGEITTCNPRETQWFSANPWGFLTVVTSFITIVGAHLAGLVSNLHAMNGYLEEKNPMVTNFAHW